MFQDGSLKIVQVPRYIQSELARLGSINAISRSSYDKRLEAHRDYRQIKSNQKALELYHYSARGTSTVSEPGAEAPRNRSGFILRTLSREASVPGRNYARSISSSSLSTVSGTDNSLSRVLFVFRLRYLFAIGVCSILRGTQLASPASLQKYRTRNIERSVQVK